MSEPPKRLVEEEEIQEDSPVEEPGKVLTEEETSEVEEVKEEELTTVDPGETDVEDKSSKDDFDFVKEYERLSAKVLERAGQTPAEAAAQGATTPPPKEDSHLVDYIGQEGVEELGFSRQQLAFINQALNSVATNTQRQIIEGMGKSVPAYIQQITQMNQLRTDFYAKHPELKDVQSYVGVIYDELAKENQEKPEKDRLDMSGLLEATAAKAKKVFKKGKATQTETQAGGNPGRGPGSGTGGRAPASKATKVPEAAPLAHLRKMGKIT